MLEDKRALLMELAYILHRRNTIEVRRRRAKSKIGYYEELKRIVKSYKAAQAKVSSLTRTIRVTDPTFGEVSILRLNDQLQAAKNEVAAFQTQKMKPFKWLDNVSGLNKRILKHRAEYMKARYDTARLTCETRQRVSRLVKLLDCAIDYNFGTGFVSHIIVNKSAEYDKRTRVDASEFEAMYREVEANKAIERVLNAKKNEEEKT